MLEPSLLALLRLVSPALPVGAFAYSQGLEGAVEQQWVNNEEQARKWISGVLRQNIAKLDLPALYWQLKALKEQALSEFCDCNKIVFAHRETAEFRLESHQLGLALLRLLRDTDAANDDISTTLLRSDAKWGAQTFDKRQVDWVSAFAIAAHSYAITPNQALLGFAWAWLETQVAAAVKLVPLGQTQGQRMLIQLSNTILQIVNLLIADLSQKMTSEKRLIGAVSPNLTIVSSLHETQYSRLFRS